MSELLAEMVTHFTTQMTKYVLMRITGFKFNTEQQSHADVG